MTKLKSLLEGFAWERNADGSLPTLKDAIATHAANLGEKAVSTAQQQAAGAALAAKRGEIPASDLKGASKAMEKMPEKELEKFAGTKHKGLPKHVDESKDDSILDLVSRAEDMIQNLRRNMATNSVLQREEKMGYLQAYDELLDVLSDIGYQAEME